MKVKLNVRKKTVVKISRKNYIILFFREITVLHENKHAVSCVFKFRQIFAYNIFCHIFVFSHAFLREAEDFSTHLIQTWSKPMIFFWWYLSRKIIVITSRLSKVLTFSWLWIQIPYFVIPITPTLKGKKLTSNSNCSLQRWFLDQHSALGFL